MWFEGRNRIPSRRQLKYMNGYEGTRLNVALEEHCAMRSGILYGRINDIKRSHKPVQGIPSCLGHRSEETSNGRL